MNSLDVQQVIRGLSVPAFLVDVNHKVKFWNKACEELTGLKEEELLDSSDHWRGFYFRQKETLADVVLKGANEANLDHRFHDKWNYLNDSREEVRVVDFLPKLSRKGKVLSFSATLLKNVDGEVLGAIETFQDISEGCQAFQKLTYSRDNFRGLIVTLKDIIIQLQREKETLEHNLTFNVKQAILPQLDEIVVKSPELMGEIDFIRRELDQLCSGFYRKMAANYKFSPAETKVLSYVQKGLRDKEIAESLHVALATVKKHKLSIRKKLNISQKSVRLSAYLSDLTP